MKNRLEGKVIIVTGGSGLLGREIVDDIRTEGGICINAELNCKTDEALNQVNCDITDEGSVKNAIEWILKKYGQINGLVNNAYPRTKDWGVTFENIPSASWRANVDMQMNSVFVFCQSLIPVMITAGSGSIVNIASIYGTVGPDFGIYEGTDMTMPAAYSAIKGGIINFSRYLAAYYGKKNIRVNCVSPGGIFDGQPDNFVKNYEARVPMGRMGSPKDIPPAVSFLLSDGAAYITGQNIIVDGGWTAI